MDSNKEEADRCVMLAKKAIQGGDLDKARRLLEKANRMYPSHTATEMLNSLNYNDSSPSKPNHSYQNHHSHHHNQNKHNTQHHNRTSPKNSHSPIKGKRRNEDVDCPNSHTERSANSSSSASETSESMCKRILKAKNFYDTLGIPKDADDAAIKKAYKKLALQLHPDKCKAPSAEEAFKRIAMAFQTLSDAEKRKNYDTFGEDGPPMHSASGDVRYYQYHQGEGFLTPEDLFRMFFGGMPAEVSFQRQRFPTRSGHSRSHTRTYTTNMNSGGATAEGLQTGPLWQKIAGVIQILPVLLMLFLAIMGNFMPTFFPEEKPIYSFNRTREYNKQRWTGIHNVSFYINPKTNFDSKFPPDSSKLQELEVKIEMIHFTRECGIEERTILQDIAYAKYYQSRSKLKEIQSRSKPNCDKLKWLRDKYPSIYRQTMRN
ncbi:uncharacterized protein cubi_02110 [Cryptosporidium ubiquitum]|uniref:J domain-containing protein n=1 Tax=Cryptosporidium ubiquitum TaxID=857276 RepID=A0A1J4MRS9_9CRYT|nr:uncharacterized protein cubi_02110 [Cryptosporidium ubiquitum]OII75589.1 hypothetical protein cubi_02110 [Cryptosporidium ubiquitum]